MPFINCQCRLLLHIGWMASRPQQAYVRATFLLAAFRSLAFAHRSGTLRKSVIQCPIPAWGREVILKLGGSTAGLRSRALAFIEWFWLSLASV